MSVVDVSIDIDASPEAVWEVVSDPNNLPRWDRHIVSVEGVPPRGLKAGSEYRTDLRLMGVRASTASKVLEFRPPRYAKVRVRGMLDATVESWVEPLDNGRARLRHRVGYSFRGGPLGAVAARGTKMLGAAAILRRGVQAQKRQVEEEAGPP